MSIVRYKHHDRKVAVQKHLKGKHREHCLCWNCKLFIPEDRENNCDIANDTYSNCIKHGITTPVWECPNFLKRSRPAYDGWNEGRE